MIKFNHITKTFGGITAADEVSFTVERGERFGLIGPDGAGKSTLIRILATLLLPDRGTVFFDNHSVVDHYRYVRKHIGYMPGTFSLYQDLSVEENLLFYARVFNTTVEANYDMIGDIYGQLEAFRKRRAGALSGGMKQKLALCCALVHKPLAMLLDEPTTGVDAVSRKEFWEMLSSLETKGITILVSTPYMDEAARCHRVALIQSGRVLDTNTPEAIIRSYKKYLYKIKGSNNYRLLKTLRNMQMPWRVYPCGEYLHLASTSRADLHALKKKLLDEGAGEIEMSQVQPDVEDCFIDLMSKTTEH